MDEKRVILVQNHPFLTVHLESWASSSPSDKARSFRRRLQAMVGGRSDRSDHCRDRNRFLFDMTPGLHAPPNFAAEFFQHRIMTVALPGFSCPNPIPRSFDTETDSDPDPELALPLTFSDEPKQ